MTRSAFPAVVAGVAMFALATGPAVAGPPQQRKVSAAAPANGGRVRLTETGSSLLYPLMSAWAKGYHAQHGQVSITTASTGSGQGIDDASSGAADIGASDAYLSSGDLVGNPNLLNIPLAISAQQVNYNLPGLPADAHVKLNGTVLAQMYSGAIRRWNDPAIQALNPGLSLPAVNVVPLHRSDSSGDTFLFTSYLATGDPAWNADIGYGTTVAWPSAPGARSAKGNSGMVQACAAVRGCVAYIGISYLSQATQAGLGYAALANATGRYELPAAASLTASAAAFVPLLPPNEAISMVNGPAPAGYPIVNYEYAIVNKRPRAGRAAALRQFLQWAITEGNAPRYLGPVRFQPLPADAVTLARDQISRIRG